MSDLINALVTGVVFGIVSGAIVTVWFQWRWRPRVTRHAWIKSPFVPDSHIEGSDTELGTLYKLRFHLVGQSNPDFCALEISWVVKEPDDKPVRQRVFAKWEEAAMPLEGHRLDQFRPELVPNSYFQPLLNDRIYDVPIVFVDAGTHQIDVFSGWWFGRAAGYKQSALNLSRSTELTLQLVGASGLRWRHSMSIGDLLDDAVAARSAKSLEPQKDMELLLDTEPM